MDTGSNQTAGQDLLPIRSFLSEFEAEVVKGLLAAFGVESFLSHDDCGGQRPHLTLTGGIRLLVRPEDAAQAEEALSAESSVESED